MSNLFFFYFLKNKNDKIMNNALIYLFTLYINIDEKRKFVEIWELYKFYNIFNLPTILYNKSR